MAHARKLTRKGFIVYLVGGRLNNQLKRLSGMPALDFLMRYNFTIGFWGVNGINRSIGFTTPDPEEAEMKRLSIRKCKKRYIVADSSKFGAISPITFADFNFASVITDKENDIYSDCDNIIVCRIEQSLLTLSHTAPRALEGGFIMIYTVTFNPALDYALGVKNLQPGMTNRSFYEQILPGGKGLNVSTVLTNLGIENTALGFIAGFTGKEIERLFKEPGRRCDFIELKNAFQE